jgi:hypothetical protein
MKKTLAVLAGVVILGGMITALNFGESVPVSELRAARLSECPPEEEVREKCPAGIKDAGDYCLCLTNKETVPNEETDLPAARKVRLVVCQLDTPEAGKHLVSRYELSSTVINKDCRLVADDVLLPGISMHNVKTGIEEKLEVSCAPCKIGPDSWGPCPECVWDNSCAAKCPIAPEVP